MFPEFAHVQVAAGSQGVHPRPSQAPGRSGTRALFLVLRVYHLPVFLHTVAEVCLE